MHLTATSINSGVPNSAPAVAALALNLLVRAPERAESRASCVSLACQLLQQLPTSDAHPVLLGLWRLARSGKVCVCGQQHARCCAVLCVRMLRVHDHLVRIGVIASIATQLAHRTAAVECAAEALQLGSAMFDDPNAKVTVTILPTVLEETKG